MSRLAVTIMLFLLVGTMNVAAAQDATSEPRPSDAVAGETPIEPTYPGGVVRTYYIAADEVDWDYAPHGDITGMGDIPDMEMPDNAATYIQRGPDRIGSVYKKAVYREYTDASFTTLVERPLEWQHLGILGPIIRAEVGDTLVVVFRNNASRPYSVHPHGVLYRKDAEGAAYNDGTTGSQTFDDAVMPGDTYTYVWQVPERSGPTGDDLSTPWLYHSHVDETRDTNTGLEGVMIIYRAGTLNEDGTVNGIDREFVTLFKIFNENISWYLNDNIQAFTGDPSSVNPDDPDFQESNLMHSINGMNWGNLPGLVMREGERVRWYIVVLGTEPDIHTPHWHGITGIWEGERTDVVDAQAAQMESVDMTIDNPGTWLFHCHVDDHMDAGMMALFRILPMSATDADLDAALQASLAGSFGGDTANRDASMEQMAAPTAEATVSNG